MVGQSGRIDGEIPGFGVDDDVVVCLGWNTALPEGILVGVGSSVGDDGVGVANVEGVEEGAVVD